MERQSPPRNPGSTHRARLRFAALAGAAAAGLAVIACWRAPSDDTLGAEEARGKPVPALARLFPNWNKPDLALVLSAQQHGYLQPCGCSEPQFGGLTRRSNFITLLKKNRWPVVPLDLGDIPQKAGLQTMLKYTTSMKALNKMGYAAVGAGEYEMNMPFLEALAHYALNNPSPAVLAANVKNKDKDPKSFDGMVKPWLVTGQKGQPRVGVIGTVGPSVEKRVKDPDLHFEPGNKTLPQMVKQIQGQKPDFLVLLYQGSVEEARACAKAMPQFDVIVCLEAGEEPPGVPERIGKTNLVTLGHKGRYVGVVGAYRTGKANRPWELRYQLVALGKEFDTSKGREKDHPVMALMEEYAREVKGGGFLAKAASQQVTHPVQTEFKEATYVGSEACKKCHSGVYEIWLKSPHAKAYKTLEDARHPSLRQYDSECISCHVTGWGYKTGFQEETKHALLKNNGCENCHGPASEHVRLEGSNDPKDKVLAKKMRDLINPYRYDADETGPQRTRRINLIDQSCQKCHDIENDVNWKMEKWWDGKIVHSADTKKK